MNARYALFVALTVALTAALALGTLATTRLLRTWRPAHNPLLLPGEIALRLALVALCIGLGLLSGAPAALLGWTLEGQLWWGMAGLVTGLGLAVAFQATTRWIVTHTGDRFYSPLLTELLAPRDRLELVAMALAFVPAVALEELLFRSLWIGGFALLLPAGVLLLTSALIFGLMHSAQGLWGMAGAVLAGIALGLLFQLSGSLLPSLVAHWVINVAQVARLIPVRRSATY